jgi:hypothetical protein
MERLPPHVSTAGIDFDKAHERINPYQSRRREQARRALTHTNPFLQFMPKNRYQEAKDRRRVRAEIEREKDMIYYVLFQRKSWSQEDPEHERYFDKVPCFGGDPEKKPDVLQRAIEHFQTNHHVSDWRDIAATYKAGGHWNG